jgi:hypothetical protein
MKPTRLFPASLILLVMLAQISFAQSLNFQSYENEKESIGELSSKYNGLCKTLEIGKSAGGKIIYALEIGKGENKNKPALLVIAGVETDDITGTVAAKNFAEQILARADADSVKNLLSKFTLYVIPRLSPDPLEACFEKTKVVRLGDDFPIDQDNDGKIDEDGYIDMDGNGMINLMRVLDPAGEWIENPDDLMLMKKADTKKGEVGKYKLLAEGIDDDKDGLINEDPKGGINVNKNTTYNYKPYTIDGGLHPFQAPELRALGDFVFEHPNIIAVYTFTYHNNLLEPWRIKNPQVQQQQPGMGGGGMMGGGMMGGRFGFGGNMFQADSVAYAMVVKDVSSLSKYKGDPQGNGDIPGWAYYDAGRLSFCAPAWTYPEIKDSTRAKPQMNRPQMQQGPQGPGSPQAGPPVITREQYAYRWIKKNAPQNFVEWHEIKHPDFPNNKVELGGFFPFAQNNPPADSLKSVADNSFKLLYKLFKDLPDIDVDTPLVEKLDNGVNRVTITISNKGKMPTHTNVGRRVKGLQSFLVKAKPANGQKIASGKKVTFIEEPIPGGGKTTRTFLIVGKGKVEFNIGSPSGGYKNVSVQL